MKKIFSYPWFWLALILLLGLSLRLYKIDIPLADHHSWRQSDTAAVIRNLATEKFDVFRPRRDSLTPFTLTALPNPNRYFFEDFPLAYDIYPALLYKLFGVQESLARLVSILFSLGTTVFLFLLLRLLTNSRRALFTALFFSLLPFSIFYSRAIMQEPAALFYLVVSLYSLARWANEKKTQHYWLLISAFFYALALLTKAYNVFFLPLTLYFFWQKDKRQIFRKKYLYLYFLIVFLPFIVWWFWISKHPEGLPFSTWLLNEGNIRFKGAWFYWLFAERIGKLILGYWGLALFFLGLVARNKKEGYFFHLWLLCLIAFFVVFAKGNVTHDYYQYLFLPLAAIFLAKGLGFVFEIPRRYLNKLLFAFLAFVCCLFMLAFSWYFVRHFYEIKGGVDLAGVAVRELAPENSLVIAGDGADPTLLYNTYRAGWTIGFGSLIENDSETIKQLKNQGAEFYVTTKVKELKDSKFGQFLYQEFKLVKETDQYAIFDLR